MPDEITGGDRREDQERRDRFDHGLRLVKIGVLIVGIASVASIVWAGKLNGDRVDEINQQRARVTRENCDGQNDRHDDTIIALDVQLLRTLGVRPVARSPFVPADVTISFLDRQLQEVAANASPAKRREASQLFQTRVFTGLLVDALAPVRDCDELVRRSVT